MVHMEQKLDQCIFIKLLHRDYSGGGWASSMLGVWQSWELKKCRGFTPPQKLWEGGIKLFHLSIRQQLVCSQILQIRPGLNFTRSAIVNSYRYRSSENRRNSRSPQNEVPSYYFPKSQASSEIRNFKNMIQWGLRKSWRFPKLGDLRIKLWSRKSF